MDTKWMMTYGLVLIGLFGMSSIASAVTLSDGNDGIYFAGETITLTWTGSSLYNYVWVTANNGNLADNTSYCLGNSSMGMQLISQTTYVLNTSKICTTSGVYYVYVNNTEASTSPLLVSTFDHVGMLLNNFTIAVSPDYTNYGVFGGDNATIVITTAGPQPASQRVGATFNVSTNETGVTARSVSTDSTAGTQTYVIPVSGTAGTFTVHVLDGAANQTGYYAVRQLMVTAIDRAANSNATNGITLTSVNQTGGLANASSSAGTNMVFAITISGKADDIWGSVAGNYTVNKTFVTGTNTAIVADRLQTGAAGTATVTASCLNFTKSSSTTYIDHAAGENITISSVQFNGTATTTFVADQIITVSGWTVDAVTPVTVNLTNMTKWSALTNTVSAANNTWMVLINTSDYSLPNVGTYTIRVNSSNGTAAVNITITDAVAISSANSTRNGTSLVSQVYVDDTLVINGTSVRADGKTLTVNITAGTYSNLTTVTVAAGKWSSTWVANSNAATGVGGFLVKVKDDNLTNTELLVTVTDNLAITGPTNAPTATTVLVKGTSSRANGTLVYVNATAVSFPIVNQMAAGANGSVSGQNWSYNWDASSLPAGTYTITATDGLTTTSAQIILGTGSLTGVAVTPAALYLDDTVNITGSTTYPVGTTVGVNITNCSGGVIWSTTTTVAADQTFLQAFTPINQAANLKAKSGLVAGGNVTLCVALNITSVSAATSIVIKDDLALTTVSSAVGGDQVMLTGTSSRVNSTVITVVVSFNSLYTQTRLPTVSGQSLDFTTGMFSGGVAYYATSDGTLSGSALPAGTYTINATDSVVTVTKTLNVVADGAIAITKPTTGQDITGGPIAIEGTSNRVNGTALNISITGQNTTVINTKVNISGMFNASWDTTGWLGGVYYIRAEVLGQESTTINMIFTATTSTTSTSTTSTTTTTIEGQTTTSTSSTTSTTLSSSAGDATGDGHVNYADLVILAASFGKSAGQDGYDVRADFNGDGVVNYADLVILAASYGH